jgi:membrane-associated protease RseP (regulator of RpoE activity)
MSNIALSLFFFNLLPLPHTDGSALLASLLRMSKSKKSSQTLAPPQSLQATLTSPGGGSPRINLDLYKEYELNSDDDEDDEELGRRGTVRNREVGWRRRLRRAIEVGCVGLGIGWILGWAMVLLLASS